MFKILSFIFGMLLAFLSIVKSKEIFDEFGDAGGLIVITVMMWGGIVLAAASMVVIVG